MHKTLNWLRELFAAPTLDPTGDEGDRGRLLDALAFSFVLTVMIVTVASALLRTTSASYYILMSLAYPIVLASLILKHRGHQRLAEYTFTIGVWVFLTILLLAVPTQFVRSNFTFYYIALIIAGLLLGMRGALATALASIVMITLGIRWLQTGWPFEPQVAFDPTRNGIALAASLLLVAFYTALAVQRINYALYQARAEIAGREESEGALRQERDLVNALMTASSAVSGSLVFEEVLDNIMEQISHVIPGDAVNIMLIEEDLARIVRWRGYDQFGIEAAMVNATFPIAETPNLQKMVSIGKPVGESDTHDSPTWVRYENFHWLRSYIGIPISIKGKVVGFLNVDSTQPDFFSKKQVETLQAFSTQIAVSIENARLFSQVQQYADDLENSFVEAALALAKTLDVRDQYTADHGQLMADRSQRIMRALGGSERDVMLIGLAAQLHDIGKIGIPDNILHKKGRLDEQEWEFMKRHPEIGADIVSRVKGMEEVADIIMGHHEWMNGSGYPSSVNNGDIPLGARIIAVVDAYGAMTEDRVYRKALGHDRAVAELQRESGSHFDPQVVAAFLDLLPAS